MGNLIIKNVTRFYGDKGEGPSWEVLPENFNEDKTFTYHMSGHGSEGFLLRFRIRPEEEGRRFCVLQWNTSGTGSWLMPDHFREGFHTTKERLYTFEEALEAIEKVLHFSFCRTEKEGSK